MLGKICPASTQFDALQAAAPAAIERLVQPADSIEAERAFLSAREAFDRRNLKSLVP